MRRWVKLSVLGVVVLGLVGYCAKPSVQDWWVARGACGGVFPDLVVDVLNEDGRPLVGTDEQLIEELGQYSCALEYETDSGRTERLVGISAYTGRDQQDAALLRSAGRSVDGLVGLPHGLPGFFDGAGHAVLRQACPALGKDAKGRPRTMLVVARGGTTGDPSVALLQAAVTGAARASDQLGCGARPLTVPDDVLSRDAKPKSASGARDSACGAAVAQLAGNARVRVAGGDTAPMVHCELFLDTPEENRTGYDDDGNGALVAYFGDWSTGEVTGHDGEWRSNTVRARCDGEPAWFRGWADEDTQVSDRRMRELVLTFAEDQAQRRGCTDVRLMPAG
ncbi:hypothetical protein H9Y04_31725 [Streptomyces sp. TRM66268-LWL]|uniref:Uncharacterized protein n=1 Tax=Streptomyces polyasparticus TaxID=2767826 RepID=A0ABR7SNP9_9ACTN|nr:hypothetical protein [Streptomyces polyasparticus]MBC9717110.1 hypothetical protein [Streptomyces polyasparticus]